MMTDKEGSRDLYYTQDHEWIDFQGMVAYTGICAFKLTGFKDIQQVNFHQALGPKSKGDSIATIHYKDYSIVVHMPVDGKVVQINEELAGSQKDLLLKDPEGKGWISLIVPTQPYGREGLILPREYRKKYKSSFHRS